jgi:hypothetical protein
MYVVMPRTEKFYHILLVQVTVPILCELAVVMNIKRWIISRSVLQLSPVAEQFAKTTLCVFIIVTSILCVVFPTVYVGLTSHKYRMKMHNKFWFKASAEKQN